MLGVFPNRFNAFDEEVDCGAVGHGRGPLHVLVETPKLVNRVEMGQCLDAAFVPPVLLALRVQGELVLQLTTEYQ